MAYTEMQKIVALCVAQQRRNVDIDRMRKTFGSDLTEAVARAHGIAVTTRPNTAHPNAPKWLGGSYGVFKYRDLYYFDTYYSNSNNVGSNDSNTWRIGVFLRRARSTVLACEIDETTIEAH